ncbi:cystatin domain-containing protein [Vibrio sinaloensis]|nr:cystatin domain-containing protein [Vibrio sinaloensis]
MLTTYRASARYPKTLNQCASANRCQGGWSQSEITPEVEQAVVTVISQMNSSSKLKQINDVRTQVVNGVNYAIEFTLENGEVWNTVVFFRNLRNDYMIEQIAKQGPLCPK